MVVIKMVKTISFVKGKEKINHNSRISVTENVDPERIKNNIIYVQQALVIAYTKLFEEAIKEYNEKQTRNDRKYGSVKEYMTKLKHSKNGEKIFYENIVQFGDMKDSGICKDDGNEEFTFCGGQGRTTRRQIAYCIEKACSKAGMPVKSAHDIRRTVASLMHKVGIPIDEIRRFLGHVDEKTTWGYIFNQYSEKTTKTMIGEALSRRTQVYSNQK